MKLYLTDDVAARRRRQSWAVFIVSVSGSVAFLAVILLLEYLIAVTMGSPGGFCDVPGSIANLMNCAR